MRRILIAIALLTTALLAQAPRGRPRVGLVLSGGGARGCAHVGVLQVLEELRIPVDVVVGTSMGSIVGGCYAYGHSPELLAAALTRADGRRPWSRLLSDASPRDLQSFRRKEEQRGFLVDFGLGYRDGQFRFPKGILQGQNLELELLELLPEAHDMASFDELPLPFRAVAVEFGSGREVVLAKGNLAHALRASMSLPAVFAPAVIDGVSLLDGGLVRNIPVQIARDLGADVLIVIDIGTPLTDTEVASALDVTAQTVSILTQQNVDLSLAKLTSNDILVRPDLGDITSADFERADESIEIGRTAALARASALRRLAVPAAEFAAWRKRQRRAQSPIRVRQLVLDNQSGLGDALIHGQLHVVPGAPLDLERLRSDLEKLYGRGDFERLTFELRRTDNDGGNLRDVIVHAAAKSWGPTYFRLGMALESDLDGRSSFILGAQANVREINSLGAEWRTNLQLGERNGVVSEFFQPLDSDGILFAAGGVTGEIFDVTGFENGAPTGAFDVQVGQLDADLGMLVGTWGQVRVGYSRLIGEVDVIAATSPTATGFDFDDGFLRIEAEIDRLDAADFPYHGFFFGTEYVFGSEDLGGDRRYQQITGRSAWFETLGNTTLAGLAGVEVSLRGDLPLYRTSNLGGFLALSGLEPGALSGPNSGFVAGMVRHQLSGRRAETFGFPVYVGGTIEGGNVWADRSDLFRDLRIGGSAFVASGTPLGPAYLAAGYSEGGDTALYVFLGQTF